MIENVATEFGKKYAQNFELKYPEPGIFFDRTEENKHFYKGGILSYNIVNLYNVYN